MNPAPPVTSTFIVRFAVLGTSAREAASLPASADDSVRLRPSSAAFPDAYRAGRREAPRPDDVVPARRGRRRRDVRARRGRGAAGRRGRGARRLARELPPLRDRLRRTASSTTCAPRRGRRLRCRCSSSRSRAPRAGRRAGRTSSTRTGFRASFPRWRPGSRSCSSSGARMRPSRRVLDRSRGGSSAVRASSSVRRRPSRTTRERLGPGMCASSRKA